MWSTDPNGVIDSFLDQVDAATQDTMGGRGLGDEIFLRGDVTGTGFTYDDHLIHLATPA